jgi:hypothetical protein
MTTAGGGDPGPEACPPVELFRALAALAEPPEPEQVGLGRLLGLPGTPEPADYTDVFLFQLYPYASVYCGAEGMLGGEARERVAGFWRALGRLPPPEPDHLSVLLALYAALAQQEQQEPDPARALLRRQSRKALLWEHLACWSFAYLDKLAEIASPFYQGWGALLREALEAEAASLGPPDALPLHLRDAPGLLDPRAVEPRDDPAPGARTPPAGGSSENEPQAFLRVLLAPVRTGIVIVRADLARAARETGLGLRMGDRRFVLASLLTQDASRTLRWLAAEARAWASRHARHAAALGDIARFWERRAAATAALLEDLGATAG